MHTWSENPKETMIQQLETLTFVDNCKRLLNGKIKSNRKLNSLDEKVLDKKAKEISFSIKQGIEFFKNAEEADISISPLLLYYGILSFSKAIIIANSETINSLDEIKYHGLTTRARNDKQDKQKSKKNHWSLLNEFANVNDGVMLELSKLYNVGFKKGDVIKLKDTITFIPEISDIIEKLNIISSNVIQCYSEKRQKDNNISFGIYKRDENKIEKIIRELRFEYTKAPMHGSEHFVEYTRITKYNSRPFDLFYQYNSATGGRYFVTKTRFLRNGKKLELLIPQIILDYINFFILSEQVRYHQDNWSKILSGKNNAIISVLKMYVNTTKRRFPNFVINELFNECFTYGTPTYLG